MTGLGGAGWWLDPTLDLPALLFAAVLGGAYVLAMRQVRARGLEWPAQRTASWALGVVSLLAVTAGGIGRSAHVLLWVFTTQTLVLLLLTPVLLAYGRPLALAADAMGERRSGQLLLLLTGRVVRITTSPLVGPLLPPLVLGAVFFTPVLPLALNHAWAGQLLRLVLLGVGMLLAVGLVGDGTERDTSLQLGAAVAIGFAEFLLDAVPGIVVRLQSTLLAPSSWPGLHRRGGLSPLSDQHRAGSVLWFIAEMADLPFLVILVRRWIRADERDAVLVDRELDVAAGPASPAGEPAGGLGRPWWETDPSRLAGHRLAAELGRREPPGSEAGQ